MGQRIVILTNKDDPVRNRAVGPLPESEAYELRDRLRAVAGDDVRVQVRSLRDPMGWTDLELIDEVL